MGRRDVYRKLAIPGNRRSQIQSFTAQSQRQVYQGAMRAELRRLGYGDRPFTLADPAVLAAIDGKASELADSIITTYNRMLWTQLLKLPDTLTGDAMERALQPFHQAVDTWNHDVLIPYTTRWTRQLAIDTLYTKNAALLGPVQWEVVGPPPKEPVCQNAVASSPMSAEEAAQIEMPAHRRCPHIKRPILPPGGHLPNYSDLDYGQAA